MQAGLDALIGERQLGVGPQAEHTVRVSLARREPGLAAILA